VSLCLGRAALAAILTFAAARAEAQITTVVATPKPTPANPQQVAQREQAKQDSIARVTHTGMTQWVDSAAHAMALRPDTANVSASDTAISPTSPAASPARQDSSTARAASTGDVEFKDRSRAPNTATPIPTFALAGAAMLMLGVLLRRRPRAVGARAKR
jgi:hypothetical protein